MQEGPSHLTLRELNTAINILCRSLPLLFNCATLLCARRATLCSWVTDGWPGTGRHHEEVSVSERAPALNSDKRGLEAWLSSVTLGTLLSSPAKWNQLSRHSSKVKICYLMCVKSLHGAHH